MKKKTWPKLKDVHTLAFDFDGVLTNNKVIVGEDGREFVVCDRADGLAFDVLHKLKGRGDLKAEIFILSTEANPVVGARARKLNIGCYQGVHDKLGFLTGYFTQRFPDHQDPFKGLIYFGNDLNDLAVIMTKCFSVVPRDAHPVVKKKASVCLGSKGGEGFVREFVERWVKTHTQGMDLLFRHPQNTHTHR